MISVWALFLGLVSLGKILPSLKLPGLNLNLTLQEMLKILEDESKNKAHEEADAFILCVLSHGANGK